MIAGLPLGETLSVLTEQSERDYIRELMAAIRAEVLGGHSFANALAQHPKDFPEIYRALVAAGGIPASSGSCSRVSPTTSSSATR